MTTATLVSASVRHKNSGAQGLGKSAKLFGATKVTVLNDGQSNTIATFPTMVDGAAAHMHLLASPSYVGLTIGAAIAKWSGNNHTNDYLRVIESRTRWTRQDYLTKGLLEDANLAIEFCKAMAHHEAGMEYPMTDAQWAEAHAEFMTVMAGGHIQIDPVKPVPFLAPFNLAKSHIGEKEIAGAKHNSFIVGCFEEIGSTYRSDETSWCAAFLGAMLKRSGCAYISGDAGCGARNYKNYGHALDEPEEGCIVVFWRESPSSWKGHVALVESFTATALTIIGGNQSNAVTRMTVPRTGPKSQVLAYRRPVPNVTPAVDVVKDEAVQRKVVGGLSALGLFTYTAWGWITTAAQFVGELVGVLPQTAATVTSTVSAGQSLAGHAGVVWPMALTAVIALCAVGFDLARTWKRLRPATGALTKPPYETDEPPVESDDVEDVFSANVVSLETEKKKRAAKPRGSRRTGKRRAAA